MVGVENRSLVVREVLVEEEELQFHRELSVVDGVLRSFTAVLAPVPSCMVEDVPGKKD